MRLPTHSIVTLELFSLHSKEGFDLQDVVVAPAFNLAAVTLAGIGTFSMFGSSLSRTLLSGSGMSVSIAFVIAFVGLTAIWTVGTIVALLAARTV